ncbi:MAG: acyl-CoA synthetase [Actinomycetota bacterium]
MQNHFGMIWESVADAVPDHIAVAQGDRRVTWADYEQNAARLAQACLDAGLGPHSKVGMYLYNSPEYAETNFAAIKFRGVPINVNYRYLDEELYYLLDNADIEALAFHSSLGDRVARVKDRLPQLKLLIEVDDGPAEDGSQGVDGAIGYDQLQATTSPAERIEPQGDELYMFYTGGTTGMPKGVMYPMRDFTKFFIEGYPAMVGLPPFDGPDAFAPMAKQLYDGGQSAVAMSGPPLMHGTGCWLGMMVPHTLGGTAVLLESRSLDPAEMWSAIEREGVQSLVIVGDAFAKPMVRALDAEPNRWDASSLRMIVSSGAMFSTEVKQAMIAHVPHLAIADVLGSTEGGMGQQITTKDTPQGETAKFTMQATTKVFDDEDNEVEPGSGVVGMVANGGLVPIGYYKDEEKSARTFREIRGERYAFIGDMATVEEDGSITLLGRGSNCINTGGEKVFPEEVEEALKVHPSVEDALVFGVPDERFGNRVVGVASLAPGSDADPEAIIAETKGRLSSYKLPKQLLVVEDVPRAPNGKANYPAAKDLFDASDA